MLTEEQKQKIKAKLEQVKTKGFLKDDRTDQFFNDVEHRTAADGFIYGLTWCMVEL